MKPETKKKLSDILAPALIGLASGALLLILPRWAATLFQIIFIAIMVALAFWNLNKTMNTLSEAVKLRNELLERLNREAPEDQEPKTTIH